MNSKKDNHVEIFISEDVHQRHIFSPQWRSTSVSEMWFVWGSLCNSTETQVPETLMVRLIIKKVFELSALNLPLELLPSINYL